MVTVRLLVEEQMSPTFTWPEELREESAEENNIKPERTTYIGGEFDPPKKRDASE